METNGIPRIDRIQPAAGIPGGDVTIYGAGFVPRPNTRPHVRFGETEASLLISTQNYLIARVPEGAAGSIVSVETSRAASQPFAFHLGVQIADNLHPVANPAVDVEGNIYVTYSGHRGQKVAVSLYKITPNYVVKPFVTELVNPTGLALDREGYLYVSCRDDGTIHRVAPDGRSQLWVEGMGVATGIAFDTIGNLFVGDRSGTIFKISPDRQIFVFATLEPSVAAYHLAFSPTGELFVTGPTTSSFDRVLRINQKGEVSTFFRGPRPAARPRLRPQGKSLRDGVVSGPPRRRANFSGRARRTCSRRQRPRRPRADARPSRHPGHQQRALHRRLGSGRPSASTLTQNES